jgi:ribosomal protein S18 acetylase RimI-like enzyme
MLCYRTFRNTDPPAVAAIWRSRAGRPGLVQPVSTAMLEQFVFGKLYFDYRGMVLAFAGQEPVGLGHAAFGPNPLRSGISEKTGVISLLLVRPEYEQGEVAGELLTRCEAYLFDRGAEAIFAGATRPIAPFYWGLCAGAEVPGVPDCDVPAADLYRARGYRAIEHTMVLRRGLETLELPMGRQELQYRRHLVVQVIVDPPSRDFWEASTMGELLLTRFELVPRGGSPVGHMLVRTMEWSDGLGTVPGAGLIELGVDQAHRRKGLATFLLKECLRWLADQRALSAEVQLREEDAPVIRMYQKLGFAEVGRGTVFRKDLGGP